LPSKVVVNFHVVEVGDQVLDLVLGELANFGCLVDVEFRENSGGCGGTNTEEGLERRLHEALLREIDVEYEDHCD